MNTREPTSRVRRIPVFDTRNTAQIIVHIETEFEIKQLHMLYHLVREKMYIKSICEKDKKIYIYVYIYNICKM